MRIRQVRPEFWTDKVIGQLPDSVRLFYIGLWNVADDAGWLEWDVEQLGALLYPFRGARRRQHDIENWGRVLIGNGRLELRECGCGFIPKLSKHQRITGKTSTHQLSKHMTHTGKQSPLTDSPVTVSGSGTVSGTERGGTGGEPSDFDLKLMAGGLEPSVRGKAG